MDWSQLGFTSGRRTYRGNKLVGGVGNSDHLNGTAADFTAPMSVLRAQFPHNHILDEGDHRHVSGLSNVPYFGRQGIAGLVKGVDTSAPKGNPMMPPRRNPIFEAMSRPVNGVDPLAPMPDQMPQPMNMGMAQPQMQQPPMGQAPQPQMQPSHHKLNGAAIMGIIGDALAAYGGQRGVFAPMMAQDRQNEAEDNRFQQHLAAEAEQARLRAIEEASKPVEITNSAGDHLRIDPNSHKQTMIYMDPYGKPQYQSATDPTTGAVNLTRLPGAPRPNAAHIAALRANPGLASEFDDKFGPGAAAYILGGQ